MVGDWSSLQEESSRASYAPCSHHTWENYSIIHFHQCLNLRRINEYNHTAIILQPITLAILLKDTVVALRQLHPPPSNLVLPPIFDYNTFVLYKTLFTQVLGITPYLSSGGFCGMVCEHVSRCFIPKDPSSRFSKLF
jgi:hypothetical protein